MKTIVVFFVEKIVRIYSYIYSLKTSSRLHNISNKLYTFWIKRYFLKFEGNAERYIHFHNGKRISIGKNTILQKDVRLELIEDYNGKEFDPHIYIGENTKIMRAVQLTALDKIHIGDNVGISAYSLIMDVVHGDFRPDYLTYNIDGTIPDVFHQNVVTRDCVSAGPVIIEDNVHIGYNCVIMPNVTIGRNSIINAHSVVTKNVPPYSIVSGNPAKVIVTFSK